MGNELKPSRETGATADVCSLYDALDAMAGGSWTTTRADLERAQATLASPWAEDDSTAMADIRSIAAQYPQIHPSQLARPHRIAAGSNASLPIAGSTVVASQRTPSVLNAEPTLRVSIGLFFATMALAAAAGFTIVKLIVG